VRIMALGESLPGEPVSNRELAERFGLHQLWLDRMTGNRARYFCDADSAPGIPKNTGDLAVGAALDALGAAGVAASTLDFLILTTASPDHLMPATVNLVAERIGVNDLPTFQIASGCAGAIQGLYTARALLAGGLRRGLVIGADSCLKMWPSRRSVREMSPAELVNFALFGDGAGAAVVDADDDGPGFVVEHVFVRTVGKGQQPAQVVRWYGTEGAPEVSGPGGRLQLESMGQEDYKAIERRVPEMSREILDELAAATGWPVADVDYVLTPQLNGVQAERIREYLAVRPDQAVHCVADTGNSGNALPFLQLLRATRQMAAGAADAANAAGAAADSGRAGGAAGSRALVATVESSKWIVSGLALRHQPEPAHREEPGHANH